MSLSTAWCWFTALLLCLQLMGGGADQNCTEENLQIRGGYYTLSNGLASNSKLLYHCPENYYPYPALSRLCQPTGSWFPRPKRRPPQTCRLVECPDPTVLEQGSVDPTEAKYYVGNKTTYECWSGYTLRGSASRICQPNGKWNGRTPICGRDTDSTCPDPGVPAGAVKVGHIYEIDETVTYSCHNNLMLVGPRERVCQENGQWTGMEPACYYKHTYDTALEVSEAFGSSIKESLTELEPEDTTTQEGRKIRIPKNDTLNIYIAMDISASINEIEFTQAKNAVIKLITKVSSFSVTPNYEILFFSSVIKELVNIIDFLGKHKPSLDDVRQKLNEFVIEQGEDLGTDLNAAFTTIMERMAWIKENTDFVKHRHVIIVFSDGGFNVGGSPKATVAKIKDMVYRDEVGKLDQENRLEYLDIYIFAIGSDIYDEELMPLAGPEGTGDKHYFRLASIENLDQTFDDIIDEEEVVSLCGLYLEKDESAKDRTEYKYPWNVEITVGSVNCLGSLVNSRFVLTAAHCFKFEDTADRVAVYTSDKQRRKVDTIYIHPEYDIKKRESEGVKEFYDYDVALLRLTHAIKPLTSNTRPICIPCTQSTSDALKLVGNSTCRQQEDLLLNKDLERLAFLTAKPIKEKDVHAKLGDRRAKCIEQAKHAYGVTTDNVALAVTDNFICTGGQDPKVDHIACSGDSGGAVFKEYERRTIQVAVVSWGVHDLCGGGSVNMPKSNTTSRDFHINLFRVAPFLRGILGKEDQFEYTPMKFIRDE